VGFLVTMKFQQASVHKDWILFIELEEKAYRDVPLLYAFFEI
jgi:hypothetical protein